jgi:hypothetical protein
MISSFDFKVDIFLILHLHHVIKPLHFDYNMLILSGHLYLFIVLLIVLIVKKLNQLLIYNSLIKFITKIWLFVFPYMIFLLIFYLFYELLILYKIFIFKCKMNLYTFG